MQTLLDNLNINEQAVVLKVAAERIERQIVRDAGNHHHRDWLDDLLYKNSPYQKLPPKLPYVSPGILIEALAGDAEFTAEPALQRRYRCLERLAIYDQPVVLREAARQLEEQAGKPLPASPHGTAAELIETITGDARLIYTLKAQRVSARYPAAERGLG